MGHTFLCVLQFFLLNTIFSSGHAQDAVLTLEPNWSSFFAGQSVTFICDMKEGKYTDWKYRWNKDGREFVQYNSHKRFTLQPLSTSHSGRYHCFGFHRSSNQIKKSNIVSLTVSDKPKAKLTTTIIPVGGSVSLSCSVNPSSGWKYYWYRHNKSSEPLTLQDAVFNSSGQISVSQEGQYWCRGGRGEPVYYSQYSQSVRINTLAIPKAKVTAGPTIIPVGGRVTLSCSV
uniref:Ig-like domain-containing protein n=1 Tax=Anabas testudineus TaxID=64144 RepID=A0A7N6FH90_ANATE